jgi:hypothetical protein
MQRKAGTVAPPRHELRDSIDLGSEGLGGRRDDDLEIGSDHQRQKAAGCHPRRSAKAVTDMCAVLRLVYLPAIPGIGVLAAMQCWIFKCYRMAQERRFIIGSSDRFLLDVYGAVPHPAPQCARVVRLPAPWLARGRSRAFVARCHVVASGHGGDINAERFALSDYELVQLFIAHAGELAGITLLDPLNVEAAQLAATLRL